MALHNEFDRPTPLKADATLGALGHRQAYQRRSGKTERLPQAELQRLKSVLGAVTTLAQVDFLRQVACDRLGLERQRQVVQQSHQSEK